MIRSLFRHQVTCLDLLNRELWRFALASGTSLRSPGNNSRRILTCLLGRFNSLQRSFNGKTNPALCCRVFCAPIVKGCQVKPIAPSLVETNAVDSFCRKTDTKQNSLLLITLTDFRWPGVGVVRRQDSKFTWKTDDERKDDLTHLMLAAPSNRVTVSSGFIGFQP